jgi:hypothetical protein
MAIASENAELILTVVGQHRNEALAIRHLRKLQKQYPEPEFFVWIAARRNAKGQYSANGHFFTFEVWKIKEEEEEEEIEYEGAFDSP